MCERKGEKERERERGGERVVCVCEVSVWKEYCVGCRLRKMYEGKKELSGEGHMSYKVGTGGPVWLVCRHHVCVVLIGTCIVVESLGFKGVFVGVVYDCREQWEDGRQWGNLFVGRGYFCPGACRGRWNCLVPSARGTP